jgi:hypothetical protein
MKYSINSNETKYYRADGLGQGPTIRSIFLADPAFPRRLDAQSVRLFLDDQLPPGKTVFTGISKHEPDPPDGSLPKEKERLGLAILYNPEPSPIQDFIQKKELSHLPIYSPSSGTFETAAPHILAALPDTVAAAEAPLDSLLPVTATLAARAMKRGGLDHAVAIHPASISPALTAAIFHAIGLSCQSIPISAKQDDPPNIDLSLYLQSNAIQELAATLNLPLDLSTPRQQIIWTTLHLLHTQMTGPLLKERKKNI